MMLGHLRGISSVRSVRSRTPAADSEVTEQQEFDEIADLLSIAKDRQQSGNYRDARSLAAEALQIDATHVGALQYLVNINIQLQRYEEGIMHADSLIDLYPKNPLGFLMKGKVELGLNHYRDCITSSLRCLSMRWSQPKEATELISKAVQGILSLNQQFLNTLQGMDYYAQMGEIGRVLLSAKQYYLAIKVLNTALQIKTQQHGVSMLVYLTLGHAECATQKYDCALISYKNCLDMAVSTHDVNHQTKSLVNMASLHVSLGETYQALVIYEKLLDMHSRLESDNIECSDIWTAQFIYGLYMNCSIAYKTVGSFDKALRYAKLYLDNMDKDNFVGLCQIHRHVGSLYQIVGRYADCLSHYKDYLAMAKCSADKLEIAQAYGHLGSLYGNIGMWAVSLVYHERHVSGVCGVLNSITTTSTPEISDKLTDQSTTSRPDTAVETTESEVKKCLVQAYEMYGDTLMLRGKYEEASDLYNSMFKNCDRKALNRCRALYKIGYSHYKMDNSQHALHYFDQAIYICEDEFTQLLTDIKFGIALSLQVSTGSGDLEKARKYFEESIDSMKSQIEECILHHKFLPNELVNKLNNAYQGMQSVLGKLGCDQECLEIAEECRIYSVRLLSRGSPPARLPERLTASEMTGLVGSQGAYVLYYSFLNNSLLIWILTPDNGLARFYVKRPQKIRGNVENELERLITPWKTRLAESYTTQLYKCERRHVQRKDLSMPLSAISSLSRAEALRSASSWTKDEKSQLEGEEESDQATGGGNTAQELDSTGAGLEKTLYKFLASPVDDILSKIPLGGHLIVIPDKSICHIPFPRLRDLKGTPLSNKYNVSYLPGLYALKMVVENQTAQLQVEDEVNFLRVQSSLGGYYKYLHSSEMQYSNEQDLQPSNKPGADRKMCSNPRLDVVLGSSDYKKTSRPGSRKRSGKGHQPISHPDCGHRMVQLTHNNEVMMYQYSDGYSLPDSPHYCLPKPTPARHSATKKLSSQQNSTTDIPQPSYHRPLDGCGKAASVAKLLRLDNLTTLISQSSTGTDALSSTTAIPEFTQISNKENFVVIGNPALSSQMVLGESNLIVPEALASSAMMSELELVSGVLGCDFIYDKQATKERFLEVAAKASVLHIATQVNLTEGYLLMSCTSSKLSDEHPIEERFYLVTVDDITQLSMRAKLVVISGGWTVRNLDVDQRKLQSLVNAFVMAGAESVLLIPHPQTTQGLNAFYKHFYTAFQQSCDVCSALNLAADKTIEEHELAAFPMRLYGNNTILSIVNAKSAMLDQNLDSVETEVSVSQVKPPLNVPSAEKVPTLVDQIDKVQMYISQLCCLHADAVQDIAQQLLHLVNDAITIVERSVLEVSNLVVLPSGVLAFPPAIQLLKLLRFNFEPRGSTQVQLEPAVVFPSWDPDGLLHRVSSCLKVIIDVGNYGVLPSLHDVLPLDQPMISRFVDALSLTHHSPDIQLSVTDDGLRPLWESSHCRDVLNHIGFNQVGVILHFNSTRLNQRLLRCMLEFFVMLSESKPEVLLTKLDMMLLQSNKDGEQEESKTTEPEQLQTILPALLPKDKLTRRVPWSSRIESPQEMRNKKDVSQRLQMSADQFNTERRKLVQLQLSTACVKAQEVLIDLALPVDKPTRVKVQSGSTASRNRVPVGYIQPLTPVQFEQRRKYSEFLKKSRLSDLQLREKHDQRQILCSFTDIVK